MAPRWPNNRAWVLASTLPVSASTRRYTSFAPNRLTIGEARERGAIEVTAITFYLIQVDGQPDSKSM